MSLLVSYRIKDRAGTLVNILNLFGIDKFRHIIRSDISHPICMKDDVI